MKKLFENKYIDHLLKSIIALCLGWFIYTQIGIRDFITYTQPQVDERQNEAIKAIKEQQSICYKVMEEKNAMTQKRIDQHADNFNELRSLIISQDKKIDIIMYHVGLITKNDLLISKNE